MSRIHTSAWVMTPEVEGSWPALPTETEIYILPNGEIIAADLPTELAAHFARLQVIETTDQTESNHVANQQHPTHSS